MVGTLTLRRLAMDPIAYLRSPRFKHSASEVRSTSSSSCGSNKASAWGGGSDSGYGNPTSREQLQRVADKLGAEIRSVDGDGNCQFRALSVVLYGHEAKHSFLRERVVEQLKSAVERYSPFVLDNYDEYVQRMECDRTWGDHITLQAASDLLGCAIQVLTDKPGLECIMVEPCQHGEGEAAMEAVSKTLRQPLCLAFITEVHYDAAFLPEV